MQLRPVKSKVLWLHGLGRKQKKTGIYKKEETIMKQSGISWIFWSADIMLLLPWLAVTFIKGDGGMAVCFLLFYGVNPVYSVLAGVFAGKDGKRLWYLPILSAALFLVGTWLFFDMGEPAFILYALVYLALGFAAMLVSMLIHRKI